jgi:hypothetical protein
VGTYDGAANVWTFTSTRTVTPPNSPSLTQTVAVQFVKVSGGTITPLAPTTGYDSDNADFDRPGSDTARIVVTLSYRVRNQTENVTLETLMSKVQVEAPKVEASGSITGVSTSGVAFQDGDIAGVATEILSVVGRASTSFREITDSTSQATADPLEVTERRISDSSNLQTPAPAGGNTSASVPNSATGTSQTSTAFVPAGTMSSVNAPSAAIASWCTGEGTCSSTSEARVSANHSQFPEGKGSFAARDFLLNARDPLEATPHRVLTIGVATGEIDQRGTTTSVAVDTLLTLTNVKVWGSTSFVSNPRYEGTVIIDSLSLEVDGTASNAASTNKVVWSILGLRVWNPNQINVDATIGGYGTSYNFGFNSSCGQWTGIPPGEPGHSCAAPFENPNPVVIPNAYAGVSGGQAATSLSIVAGATLQEKFADASQGISNANSSQKSVLTITTRDDVSGAAALEPSNITLGAASATVSFITHEH